MDGLIRLIEGLIRGIVTGIQPLIENGNLGYLMPFILLGAATYFAVTARNRMNLTGYALGWVIAVALIGLYQEGNGDNILNNLTGQIPRPDLVTPILSGFLVGFLLLFPFLRQKLSDVQPLIIALVTGFAIMLLFLTYRASVSITVVESAGVENLIAYRKRFVGVFSLTFGIGVLLHVLISAANPPPPPPPTMFPPAVPPQQR